MQTVMPAVIYPQPIVVNGYRFRVHAHYALTEREAQTIALRAYRCRKWTKKDLEKVHVQYWIGQRQDLARLESLSRH